MMIFRILTLFPGMFPGPLTESVTGRARDKGVWDFSAVNIRDFAPDRHKTVDDVPFGGGAGMVMKADVLEAAFLSLPSSARRVYLSPRGRVLTQAVAGELSRQESLTLLCGRYEGVDQRFLNVYGFEEISIGDYVLTNGEIAAYALMDSVIRLLPGALGNAETPREESFSAGLLEYPQYTRPALWQDRSGAEHPVPEVLISGNHAHIAKWRLAEAQALTRARRPDLWKTQGA